MFICPYVYILLAAGTKFSPKFSRDFCSSVNSVSVKLMTACFIYDIVFCLPFFLELFFSFSNLLIRWFFFFVNSFSLDFSVVRSISAKCPSFILLFKFSQIYFTFTFASCIRCLTPIFAITISFRLYSFMMLNVFSDFIGLFI